MPFTRQGAFVKKTTDLPDVPSPTYTATQIKDYIQNPSDELMATLNDIVDKLNATASGASGADNIGATDWDGVTASTVGALLSWLKANKTDLTGDHKGTWQGYTPSMADPGISAVVDQHTAQLANIAKDITLFPIITPEVDDTARFQRAFDSGYHIILEKGKTYTVNNVHLNQDGFILFGNRAKLATSDITASCIIIDSTSKNIKILNTVFQGCTDGTNDNPAGVKILESGIDATRDSSTQNVEIAYCDFLGGFVFSVIANGVTGLKIHHCYSTGNKYVQSVSAGGYFVLLQTCYDVEIYRNKAVATATDRHAVYVSCNNSLTGDKGNENVDIHDNYFDWRLANAGTQQEGVIATRTTRRIDIHDNVTLGGWFGIAVNPSHGDYTDVNIHDNKVLDVIAGTNENKCIGSVLQDKGGNYKVRNLKLHNNEVSSTGDKIHGYTFVDTIGFELLNNVATVSGSGSFGVEISNCSDGIIEGNRLNGSGSARTGIEYLNTNDDIVIGTNKVYGFTFKEEVNPTSVTTNLKHKYKRSAQISSNGAGSITIPKDDDGIISSVVSDPNGCIVTFNKHVKTRNGFLDVNYMGSSPTYFYNRLVDTTNNTMTIGMKSFDGVSTYPLGTTIVTFEIVINE